MKNFLATTFSLFLLPVFFVLSIVIITLLGIGLVIMLPLVTVTIALNSAVKLASFILQKLASPAAHEKNDHPIQQTIALFILTPIFFVPLLPITFLVVVSMAVISVPFLVPILIFCLYCLAKDYFKGAFKDNEVIKPAQKEQKSIFLNSDIKERIEEQNQKVLFNLYQHPWPASQNSPGAKTQGINNQGVENQDVNTQKVNVQKADVQGELTNTEQSSFRIR